MNTTPDLSSLYDPLPLPDPVARARQVAERGWVVKGSTLMVITGSPAFPTLLVHGRAVAVVRFDHDSARVQGHYGHMLAQLLCPTADDRLELARWLSQGGAA